MTIETKPDGYSSKWSAWILRDFDKELPLDGPNSNEPGRYLVIVGAGLFQVSGEYSIDYQN
jgi:hypothetical protein